MNRIMISLVKMRPSVKKPEYWHRLDFLNWEKGAFHIIFSITVPEFRVSRKSQPEFFVGFFFLFEGRSSVLCCCCSALSVLLQCSFGQARKGRREMGVLKCAPLFEPPAVCTRSMRVVFQDLLLRMVVSPYPPPPLSRLFCVENLCSPF